MIRAIIIDDEKHSIKMLQWKIEKYCTDVEIIETFLDSKRGLSFIENNKIDLLFLDIEMPELNGFDLLQKVNHPNFDVIFTTAYDEYGIRAIKYSALDYLLKPVQEEELIEAITKFKRKQNRKIIPQQLEVLFQSLQQENSKNQKIALSTKESIELVHPSEIILCESDNNYTMVFMKNRKKFISKTLKEFEELLSPFNFFRSHQSYLINIDQMVEYKRQDGGQLIMSNGMSVPVSRSKKEALLKLF